jgi:hypothetical protein
MDRHILIRGASTIILVLSAAAQCPVTTPQNPPFVPPAGYRTDIVPQPGFWYGTKALWTWISTDSSWWLGDEKIVYWRSGFDARNALDLGLNIVARRLDVHAPLVWSPRASPMWFPEADGRTHFDVLGDMAMMSGIDISPGRHGAPRNEKGACWEISAYFENPAHHEEDQTLSFVVSMGQ